MIFLFWLCAGGFVILLILGVASSISYVVALMDEFSASKADDGTGTGEYAIPLKEKRAAIAKIWMYLATAVLLLAAAIIIRIIE